MIRFRARHPPKNPQSYCLIDSVEGRIGNLQVVCVRKLEYKFHQRFRSLGLTNAKKAVLRAASCKLKSSFASAGVKDEDHIPTHLIVSGSTASETLKDAFSQRLLSSVTIVTADWVIESLQAKQKLSEELYKGSGTVSIHSEDVREGSVQPVSAPPSLLIAKSDGTYDARTSSCKWQRS